MQTEPGRRERKKTEQRHALQRAALRLAAEHGYDHLTVEAIAEACDISTRTFFNYFSSKDEALLGPVMDRHQQFLATFNARPAEEAPIESLRHTVVSFAEHSLHDSSEWQAHKELLHKNHGLLARVHGSFAEAESDLTKAVAERLKIDPDQDPYPALMVAVALTVLRVAALHTRTRRKHEDTPQTVDRLFDIATNGLATPPRNSPRTSKSKSKRDTND